MRKKSNSPFPSTAVGDRTVTRDDAKELLAVFLRQEVTIPSLDARRLSQAYVRIRSSKNERACWSVGLERARQYEVSALAAPDAGDLFWRQ